MICSHCGKTFERGQVYCPHCGKMQQLVPDYFEAEEQILRDHDPAEEKRTAEEKKAKEERRRAAIERAEEQRRVRKRRRRRRVVIVLTVILIVCLIAFFVYRGRQRNNYDTQMSLAQTAFDNGNYDKGITYASRALTLNGGSIEARLLLYRLYEQTGVTDAGLLTEVLDLDPDNEAAYILLISCYDEAGDYDALLELAENVADETLLTLFDGFLTAAPELSPESGSYEHNTVVTITSEETVYYTTDGSMPTEDSDVYEDGIELTDGTWTVTAIAVDADGHRSLAVSTEYVISLLIPSAVTFSPSGGTYYTAVSITLTAEEGCTIYYGWDTTDADMLTSVYTGSISMPEGNHILSAVAVSEDGVLSALRSRSFIYLPD